MRSPASWLSSAAPPSRPAARPPGASNRSEYLWDVLRTLWPEPARIARCGRRTPPGAGRTEFVIVPGEARAALLLPRRPRRAAAGALRHYKASASPRRRLLFGGLALAARIGLAEVLPERISIDAAGQSADSDIAGYLAAALDQETVVSLRIGPPRANRKPVLELLTADGRLLGYAKVGVTGLTRDLVRAEAAALALLGGAPLARLAVPPLLHHGQWRGHEVLVQGGLSGSGPARNRAELSGAMAEVATVRGITRLPATQSPYWQQLRPRLAGCPQRDLAGAVHDALSWLEPAAAVTSLDFGSWHGDWTPWNMTMSRGRVMVWDWERFQTGVPVGYDAIHYRLQEAASRGGVAPRDAAEATVASAAEALAPFGIGRAAAPLVATLYLAENAIRYLHDGQAEAGARLGDVGSWLLPVLLREAGELGGTRRPGGPGDDGRVIPALPAAPAG
jgi:hypothetical protein